MLRFVDYTQNVTRIEREDGREVGFIGLKSKRLAIDAKITGDELRQIADRLDELNGAGEGK